MQSTPASANLPARRWLALPWLASLSCCLLSAKPAQALLLLNIEQSGADVVVRGSGTANTLSLNNVGTSTTWTNVITDSQVYTGPDVFSNGLVSLWSNLSGPSVFGSDSTYAENPSAGTGDLFGILANDGNGVRKLVLPAGYTSGSSLSGNSTFPGRTLADMGLTDGKRYVWIWGSGGTADQLVLTVGTPAPVGVPSPLAVAGTAAAFHRFARLRRRCRRARL